MKIIWKDRKHFLIFPFSFQKYSLTEDRLLWERGLLNTKYEEIYLFRILDCKCERSFLQKLWGTGTVTLITADKSQPFMLLENVKEPFKVKEMLSKMVIEERRKNRVMEISNNTLDFQDEDGDGFPDFLEN